MAGVSFEEFKKAHEHYPSLRIRYATRDSVYVVVVSMVGIKGKGSRKPQRYSLLIDLRPFPYDLPHVFITHPKNRQIKHRNIFPPCYCSVVRKDFPKLCPGALSSLWNNTKLEYRTFLAFLRSIHEVLSNENPHSPARR
ncbi:MAG: hypothetical protein ACTSUF_10645 [Candidatus Heimdallarchaeaceae archaeon]